MVQFWQGTAGNDTFDLFGTPDYLLSWSIDGKEGNDFLRAGSQNDTIIGGAGNDTLDGEAGNDLLYGGTGNDSFDADSGNDTVYHFPIG